VTIDVAGTPHGDDPADARTVGEPGDLSDELIARPTSTQDVLERIVEALERIEAKIDGTWREGPNPL
jgi:hypothetical protein